MQAHEQTILLEIPAYRDPELVITMRSSLVKADHPENIHFAICYQSDDLVMLEEVRGFQHCKVLHIPEAEARGSCYARYQCQQMLEDETYVLHLDAHMRFSAHWDTVLIHQLQNCPGEKSLITFYPPDYYPMRNLPVEDPAFDKLVQGRVINAYQFEGSCCLRSIPHYHISENHPIRGAFISAACLFGYAQMDRDVPIDPEMFLVGDECAISLRLFTHGYQVWHPHLCCIRHLYAQEQRPSEVHDLGHADDWMSRERYRIRALYGEIHDERISDGPFGLGRNRSVQEFEAFAGVDYHMSAFSEMAHTGRFDSPSHENCRWYYQHNQDLIRVPSYDWLKRTDDAEILIAIPSYCDTRLLSTIQDLREKAANPERLHFAVCYQGDDPEIQHALSKVPNCRVRHLAKQEAKGVSYALHLLDAMIEDEPYVLFIESHMKAVPDWDRECIRMQQNLGENAVLTQRCPSTERMKARRYEKGYRIDAAAVDSTGQIEYRYTEITENHPVPGVLTHGHMLFGRSEFVRRVPHDPDMFVHNEYLMSSYSMRLWSCGYDVYYPDMQYFYHEEETGSGNVTREYMNDIQRNLRAEHRMLALIGTSDVPDMNLGIYGLGTLRTFQNFEWNLKTNVETV